METENETIGEYLELNYLKKVRNMERRVCNCFKGKTDTFIKTKYPECLFVDGTDKEVGDELIGEYWGVILFHLKKKYPALMMEVYLLQEFERK